jgi:hypothetical protein
VQGRIFISGQIGLVPSSLSIPSPQTLATEISLVSQHFDRVVKALSNRHDATGGRLVRDSDSDGHAQMILYWVTEERHIPYSIMAAQHLDVSPTLTQNLNARVFSIPQISPSKKGKKKPIIVFAFL